MKQTQKGLELLAQGKINQAMQILSTEFNHNPQNTEAKMGILLCDIATTQKSKALGLLEFYYALCFEEDKPQAQKKLFEIIQSLDTQENNEVDHMQQKLLENSEALSCITYEDFKNFIFTKPSFKEAFEDFSLSTKIVFSDKSELCDFLNLLIDNGYANLSLEYAQNIRENMGFDIQLNQILERAIKTLK